MNEEKLIELLDKALSKGEKKRDPLEIATIASSILLPIALAVCGFFFSRELQANQLKVAEQLQRDQFAAEKERQEAGHAFQRLSMERDAEGARQDRQAKYLEIFYNELYSDDEIRQKNAFLVLKSFQVTEQLPFLESAIESEMLPPSVREEARAIADTLPKSVRGLSSEERATFSQYRLGIYFKSGEPYDENMSGFLSGLLTRFGLFRDVKLYPNEPGHYFWNDKEVGAMTIRYNSPAEMELAEKLRLLLLEELPGTEFKLLKVGTSTPGFLSIFIDGSAKGLSLADGTNGTSATDTATDTPATDAASESPEFYAAPAS